MSISQIFGDNGAFESVSSDTIHPLFTLGDDLEKDEKVLAWVNNCYTVELKRIAKYRETALKHLRLFEGEHYASGTGNRAGYAESSAQGLAWKNPRVSKLVINYLAWGTQQRVSLITRNRPAVTIEPVNSEYEDRISARMVKYLVDYQIWRNDFDRLMRELALSTYIIGESYLHPYWDPNQGQPMRAWKKAEQDAKERQVQPELVATDAEGKPVLSEEDGKPLKIQKPVRTGDIAVMLLTPLNCIVESCGDFEKAKYFIREEWRDIDELRAENPDVAKKIEAEKANDGQYYGDAANYDPSKVLVRHFWHKPTDHLGAGRYIVSTRTAVLENKPLEEGMVTLPLVRLSDIDVPGKQRALSLFTQGKGINATLNDFASMMRRNTILAAHPRWLIPHGSLVKKDATGNDISQIEYKGATEPRMVSPPPLSQEVTALRREFRDEFQQTFRISDAQRGIIPPNIRSAMAMQMVDEADMQRASTEVGKYQAVMRHAVEKMLEIAACYYQSGDPRLIPVVGRSQRYMLKAFDPQHLQKGFDVRVQNSSGMPATKSARTEMLIQLKKAFPQVKVLDEQVADIMEFADVERFYDQATVASRAAEAENEAILSGEQVADPVLFENTLVHWNAHMREVQNYGFKTSTPPEIQQTMVLHLMATEMLMLQAARNNPRFALELVKLPQFPVFYQMDTVDRLILDRARLQQPLTLMDLERIEQSESIPPQLMPMPGGPVVPPPSAQGEMSPEDLEQQQDPAAMGPAPDTGEDFLPQ